MEPSPFYDSIQTDLRDETLSSIKLSSKIQSSFMSEIKKKISKGNFILDIGTGNGYVLRKIGENFGYLNLQLTGIDFSEEMIKKAKENLHKATFIRGDNYKLPFKDKKFDLVVAKNVTRFSPEETYRVLKNNGYFIFREYGEGKGLVEISELFTGRIIRKKDPDLYRDLLGRAGFKNISIEKFKTKTKYPLQQLLNILKMFPFIKNYSSEDEKKIIDFFGNKKEIEIRSDPILITAKK